MANYNPSIYINQNSLIHSLDPRSKIFITLVYILGLAISSEPIKLVGMAGFALIMVLITRIPLKYYWEGFKTFWIIIFLTTLAQLFVAGGTLLFSWGFIIITTEGLGLAALMLLRLVLIVISSQILLMTTSSLDMIDGLERILRPLTRLGLPTGELLMIMTIAIRFLPIFLQEAYDIRGAQIARGADFYSGSLMKRLKMQLAILVPLLNIVLQRAEELTQVLEARCYRPGVRRTRLREIKMAGIDYAAISLMLIMGILVLIPTS
jgi:energy-coupling factor transport system permease protein